MKNILRIREELSRFEGGRFQIQTKKPSLRTSRVSTCKPVCGNDLIVETNSTHHDLTEQEEKEVQLFFKRLDEEISREGFEALAWYVSFHNSHDDWGIFIPTSSIQYLATRLAELNDDHVSTRYEQIALRMLLLHETFHFYVDYAQTQFELILKMPCRHFLRQQFKNGGYLEIEEAAANAFMYKHLTEESDGALLHAVRKFIEIQPAGYREGYRLADDIELFTASLEETIKSYVGIPMLSSNSLFAPDTLEWNAFYPELSSDLLEACSVHLLHDCTSLGLPDFEPKFFTSVSDIRETKHFKKRFAKLDPQYQRAWVQKKQELSVPPLNRKQFEGLKPPKKGIYSVRVGKGHRAHLKPFNGYEYWEATDIGTHTELGHD
jgi:plasmid maintenance system killer protein